MKFPPAADVGVQDGERGIPVGRPAEDVAAEAEPGHVEVAGSDLRHGAEPTTTHAPGGARVEELALS